jgi:hypothetical protein
MTDNSSLSEDEMRERYAGVPRECRGPNAKPLPFYGGIVADPTYDDGRGGGFPGNKPIRKVMPDGSLQVVRILDPLS